jgi:benzoyl-CoA reductase/2-hydroxyglutaryl-CoA dehydratase subunit BcrC/BadD/HgdB
VPEELFHAAGFTPVFLFHTAQDRGQARAHLPGFTCWVASCALDQALAGEFDGLAGVSFAETCDTIQGLTDLWRRNLPRIPVFHFGMPTRLDGPIVRAYLLAELRDLRRRIEAFIGHPISDDALRASIVLYNRTRALVRALYARAAGFSPPDLYARVRAAFQMPKEVYNGGSGVSDQGLGAFPHFLTPSPSLLLSPAPLLILVGPTLADPVLFDVLAQAGARVAGDLLDLGERYFAVDAAEDGDPLEALADRLLGVPPVGGTEGGCPTPTKYHPQCRRADHLLALVRERGAHGVLFARQKFCEPHGFDCALMKPVLDKAGIPHLLIELEQASQAGQLRTRVEAFVEMLGSPNP